MRRMGRPLLDADVPAGFRYEPEFLTSSDEALLAAGIAGVTFSTFEMRGVAARRGVAFFGGSYDSASASVLPLPPFLMPLRERVAAWADVLPDTFEMALINDYPPGAPIGWHR